MRFIVDAQLPSYVDKITLAYTIFDTTQEAAERTARAGSAPAGTAAEGLAVFAGAIPTRRASEGDALKPRETRGNPRWRFGLVRDCRRGRVWRAVSFSLPDNF